MAQEPRRDGGRSVPLAADDWKPRSRTGKKRFGLKIHYHSIWFNFRREESSKTYTWQQWYATERARHDAEIAMCRSPWRRITKVERVER